MVYYIDRHCSKKVVILKFGQNFTPPSDIHVVLKVLVVRPITPSYIPTFLFMAEHLLRLTSPDKLKHSENASLFKGCKRSIKKKICSMRFASKAICARLRASSIKD